MNRNEIQKKVLDIVTQLAPLTPKGKEAKRWQLAGSGDSVVMDSVVALQLVLAVEEAFGIVVDDNEIGPENFGQLSALCDYVENKLRPS